MQFHCGKRLGDGVRRFGTYGPSRTRVGRRLVLLLLAVVDATAVEKSCVRETIDGFDFRTCNDASRKIGVPCTGDTTCWPLPVRSTAAVVIGADCGTIDEAAVAGRFAIAGLRNVMEQCYSRTDAGARGVTRERARCPCATRDTRSRTCACPAHGRTDDARAVQCPTSACAEITVDQTSTPDSVYVFRSFAFLAFAVFALSVRPSPAYRSESRRPFRDRHRCSWSRRPPPLLSSRPPVASHRSLLLKGNVRTRSRAKKPCHQGRRCKTQVSPRTAQHVSQTR